MDCSGQDIESAGPAVPWGGGRGRQDPHSGGGGGQEEGTHRGVRYTSQVYTQIDRLIDRRVEG